MTENPTCIEDWKSVERHSLSFCGIGFGDSEPILHRDRPTLTGQGVFRDVYSVMNAWGANHGTISCGHIGAELITLAAMLRIPVYMHNVAEEKVFRPSAWTAFGTADLEGADFRACANFGPLYGNTR